MRKTLLVAFLLILSPMLMANNLASAALPVAVPEIFDVGYSPPEAVAVAPVAAAGFKVSVHDTVDLVANAETDWPDGDAERPQNVTGEVTQNILHNAMTATAHPPNEVGWRS